MIYVTGDTHAEFNRFGNKYFDISADDYVIICGDFSGVWDDSAQERYWLKWLSDRPFTTLFISGSILHVFEETCPADSRSRDAAEAASAWVSGEITVGQARNSYLKNLVANTLW